MRKTEEIHDVHHKPPRLSFSSNFKDLEHENNGFLKKNVSSLKIKEIDKNSKQNGSFLKKNWIARIFFTYIAINMLNNKTIQRKF